MDLRAQAMSTYTEIDGLGQFLEENRQLAMQCAAKGLLALYDGDIETAMNFLQRALGHREIVVRIRKLQRLARLLMPLTDRWKMERSQETGSNVHERSLALLYNEIARNSPFS